MSKTEAATDGTVTTQRGIVISEKKGTAEISMPVGLFIDLQELLTRLKDALETGAYEKQTDLNFAFKALMKTTASYMRENLETLSYFNELCTAIAAASDLVNEMQPAFGQHLDTRQNNL